MHIDFQSRAQREMKPFVIMKLKWPWIWFQIAPRKCLPREFMANAFARICVLQFRWQS